MPRKGVTYTITVTASTKTSLEVNPTTLPVFFGDFKYMSISKKMTKLSKIRGIKERETANDVLFTPLPVAIKLIEMAEIKETDKLLDPCKGEGAFFDHLPNCEKDYCEIVEGKDFFDYDKQVDIIICNPPFSLYTRWINKCIYLSPKKIAFIMGSLNLTTKRLKILEDGGYFLTKMHICNCRGWFSNTLLVVFEKGSVPIISYEPGWF